ncbi:Co2+/Mg2+ efflux protein ApaG [Neptuniibacter sp. CAU 1671]|uniref:Co2+/Mg2+ efflux protein ApaG n=1 Tax=Neptuniibacter sp. CAU 1671 TaxID=3032593 RepID=UPI0023D994A9|nr:Co2+/Mg2+ efflux protein ApaG [Neptuniibacter sp. CAU 1671]MDF2181432.1 Co2+/Mg2+ efflux protein ApaG [Neptuniibacter sp. CAU 1671]
MNTPDYGDNIEINVETAYLAQQSDPAGKRFVFSYQITITNHNPVAVQLLRRRWVITDGNQQVQEVEGEGVVGETPIIEPDQSYQYTSGAVLTTSVGSMQGYYQMRDEAGEKFRAMIPTFTLARPNALH